MRFFLKSTVFSLSLFLALPLLYCAQISNCPAIEASASKYLAANQYNEFIQSLDNFKEKDKASLICLDFYRAKARYLQLRYLEEKQSWDEYFASGNTYRQELEESALKVINQADTVNPLRMKARLLLWQFHQGQQDALAQAALEDLFNDTSAFAKEALAPELIKEIADTLSQNQEKIKARQIYKLYVDQLVKQDVADADIKKTAAAFYKEGNLELSEPVFNLYIERISKNLPPEKAARELFEIASMFVYKPQGLFDMAYAEEIYAKIEGLGIKDAFDQETMYLRAFNLEKLRAYGEAKKIYFQLSQFYPGTKYLDEINFKIGIIDAYALSDINEAKKQFEPLCSKSEITPHVISSCYQLGLLAQWAEDFEKAKNYYEALIKNAADKYIESVAQAKERLKEIEENKPIEYNLKTFLDLSLKNGSSLVEMGKAEFKFSSFLLQKGEKAQVSSVVNMPQSGCNQVELQYLWSGDLAGAKPSVNEASFECSYPENGTKVINVVVVSPAGTIDRSFTMLDVY